MISEHACISCRDEASSLIPTEAACDLYELLGFSSDWSTKMTADGAATVIFFPGSCWTPGSLEKAGREEPEQEDVES